MSLTKELRREACKTGVPLTLILLNSGISRRSFYNWDEGICAPSLHAISKLENALKKTKILQMTLGDSL